MKNWITNALGCLAVVTICGCVSPGEYDVNDMYRLQQSILDRSPQNRPAEGLGLMRPTENSVPELPVTKDDKNQRVIKLSLRQAVMRALANNPDVAVVSFNPQIAREQVIQAAAAFDYTIFGSLGFTKSDTALLHRSGMSTSDRRTFQFGVRQTTVTGATVEVSNTMLKSWDDAAFNAAGRWYNNDLAMSVTQPLLRGAWPEVNLAALKIARLDYKSSMSQFRQQVEQIVVSVMTSYYQLIQARREVKIAQSLLDKTVKTYEQVKGRSNLDATRVQIKQSESAVKRREATLVQAKKALKDVQDQLARQLGDDQINLLQDYILLPTSDLSSTPVKIDLTDQLLTSLRLNPQLEQARIAIQQADINVKVAKNATLPTLNLTAGATLNGGSRQSRHVVRDDVASGRFASYNAMLSFEYPLGNRQALSALRATRMSRMQSIASMQATADTLAQTIKERIRQIETRHKEYKIQEQALAAAVAQLDALTALENIRGRLTPEFLNLKLNAQAEVAQAEVAELTALVQYNTAMLDLAAATGSVLEMNQVKLALPVVSQPQGVKNPLTLPKATK